MPSMTHELLIELFRQAPSLVPRLLSPLVDEPFPVGTLTVEEADFTQLVPTTYRADLVVTVRQADGTPAFSAIVEPQLGVDGDKRFSWPVYVSALRARLRCPACVAVVALDPTVAAWAGQPISLGPGSRLTPLVVGKATVPRLVDPAEATAQPELAVLSSLLHGGDPGGSEVVKATVDAVTRLDDDHARVYLDWLQASLGEIVRLAMEEFVDLRTYEYQSEFARKYYGQGKAEGMAEGEAMGEARSLLRVLRARAITVSDAQREQVLACQDLVTLDRWLDRAVTATTADEVFQ